MGTLLAPAAKPSIPRAVRPGTPCSSPVSKTCPRTGLRQPTYLVVHDFRYQVAAPLPEAWDHHRIMNERIMYVVDDTLEESGETLSWLAARGWKFECYASGREFLDRLNPAQGACLLLDLRTRDLQASEIQAELAARGVALPTIIVTGYANVRTAVEALQRGAIDLFEKPVYYPDLLKRIEQALARDHQRREHLAVRADWEARWASLTDHERAVAMLIMDGKSNGEMANQLGCGRRTIDIRRATIMLKLGATSLAHLVRLMCVAGMDQALQPVCT